MLAHVGSAMGIICAENIAGVETITLDYEMMPRATYCHPQVASFGLTEAQAKERGYNIKIGRFPFQANGKALGLGDYAGFVKIVMDENTAKFWRAHDWSSDRALPELTLAHLMELTPHEIARNVHAHPSLSEVLMEAAHAAEGSPIHI
jgi:dihydrolipoamide dehydrogenase